MIVFDTPVIRKETLKDIDLHIQSGKGAIIMLDPFQRMNSANAALSVKPSKNGQINSINDLLGILWPEFSNSKVVGDFKNAATVESATGRTFHAPIGCKSKTRTFRRNTLSLTN